MVLQYYCRLESLQQNCCSRLFVFPPVPVVNSTGVLHTSYRSYQITAVQITEQITEPITAVQMTLLQITAVLITTVHIVFTDLHQTYDTSTRFHGGDLRTGSEGSAHVSAV